MRKLSGNHAAWLSAVAREIREAGKPVSLAFLYDVVPSQFATATNDGHVTAAANGYPRNDYRAGQRIWVDEAITALHSAGLIDGPDDRIVWIADQDGEWKVPFRRGIKPTIYGRAESEAARDRHMLGDGGRPGYLLTGWSEVEVEIEVGAGEIKKGRHVLQVHPLALTIPPMTADEQEAIRADIAEHGVRQPLMLFDDPNDTTARGKPKKKVLDGRHRLQFASALGKPVRVDIFEGSESDARQYVASLNLHRRHLLPTQRVLAALRLFAAEAKAEATADKQKGRPRSTEDLPSVLPEDNGSKKRGKEWHQRVYEKAGGKASGITAAAIKTMAVVLDAPETAAKVDAGKIVRFDRAKLEARKELEFAKESKQNGRTHKTTIDAELSRAIGHVSTVLREDDLPLVGSITDVEEKLARLLDLCAELEVKLKAKRKEAAR